MIASKIADCFRKAGNGNPPSREAMEGRGNGLGEMIHDFLRNHCAGVRDSGKKGNANDGYDEFRDVPDSVEALVCGHDS